MIHVHRATPRGDKAGRPQIGLEGPPSARPTNAAIAVPTASIGFDPEATSWLYASRARFSRSRPLLVATAYTVTAKAAIFTSRVTPGA